MFLFPEPAHFTLSKLPPKDVLSCFYIQQHAAHLKQLLQLSQNEVKWML